MLGSVLIRVSSGLLTTSLLLSACGFQAREETGRVSSAVGAASMTTDRASYATTDIAVVSFADLPGNATDWIALARVDAAPTSYVSWLYAGTATGARMFPLTGLSGTYVARAFENNGYTMLAESAPFSVNAGAHALAVDAATYAPGATITASYQGLPASEAWLALALAGAPVTSRKAWTYTGGATGTQAFTAPEPGTYVIRAFENDALVIESSPFIVAYPAPSTNKASYTPLESVQVSFSALPGLPRDWVAIATQGAAPNAYVRWRYAGGASGTLDFGKLPPGTYVARAFATDSFSMYAESSAFTVAYAPSFITTDATSYPTGANVDVSFTDLRGNARDWITVAPAGAPLTTHGAWRYAGAVSGTTSFSGLAAGSYVARAFLDDGFTLLAESDTFTVSAPTRTITTNAASYVEGAAVDVTYANLPGHPLDWIAVAPSGSANTTYVRWLYRTGSGMATFSGLPAGTYRARAFAAGGYDLLAESEAFTVVSAGVSLSTDASSYAAGGPIVLTFSGMPGGTRDWFAIAPVGAAPGSYATWAYAYGRRSGSIRFPGVPSGSYTVRAFYNDGTTIQAESAVFTVAP